MFAEGCIVANDMNKPISTQDKRTSPQLSTGADIVVQCLVNHGVDTIFAYPGGSVIPLHQALTRFRDRVRVILPRHEQGGGFAAQGYARSTGKVGVCMATSGPGATIWSPPSPTPSSTASRCWPSPARWAPP